MISANVTKAVSIGLWTTLQFQTKTRVLFIHFSGRQDIFNLHLIRIRYRINYSLKCWHVDSVSVPLNPIALSWKRLGLSRVSRSDYSLIQFICTSGHRRNDVMEWQMNCPQVIYNMHKFPFQPRHFKSAYISLIVILFNANVFDSIGFYKHYHCTCTKLYYITP